MARDFGAPSAEGDRQAQPSNNGESIEDQRESSSESLEAFVADAEHKCNLMAQDMLAGQEGDEGNGEEGVAATSFDNSLIGEAASLCSLQAELAQATPESAGIVFIEEGEGDDERTVLVLVMAMMMTIAASVAGEALPLVMEAAAPRGPWQLRRLDGPILRLVKVTTAVIRAPMTEPKQLRSDGGRWDLRLANEQLVHHLLHSLSRHWTMCFWKTWAWMTWVLFMRASVPEPILRDLSKTCRYRAEHWLLAPKPERQPPSGMMIRLLGRRRLSPQPRNSYTRCTVKRVARMPQITRRP